MTTDLVVVLQCSAGSSKRRRYKIGSVVVKVVIAVSSVGLVNGATTHLRVLKLRRVLVRSKRVWVPSSDHGC